jgi:arginase
MNWNAFDDSLTGAASNAPVLVGVPFDANSSFMRGPAEAPPRIREALLSPASNPWTETSVDLSVPGKWLDAGDLDLGDEARAFAEIEEAIARVRGRGLRPVSLGGDHSITYPILRGLARDGASFDVLHFDAHPDLYDELDGNRLSHASPFARIMEAGLARRLVQVGIRTMNAHQRDQADRFGVEVFEMRGMSDRLDIRFDRPVYVTFDMDALDPAFAPGVSHHEPGGLSTRDALRILHSVDAPIVGADVVELNPRRDVVGITAGAASKIVKEILGLMLAGESRGASPKSTTVAPRFDPSVQPRREGEPRMRAHRRHARIRGRSHARQKR